MPAPASASAMVWIWSRRLWYVTRMPTSGRIMAVRPPGIGCRSSNRLFAVGMLFCRDGNRMASQAEGLCHPGICYTCRFAAVLTGDVGADFFVRKKRSHLLELYG